MVHIQCNLELLDTFFGVLFPSQVLRQTKEEQIRMLAGLHERQDAAGAAASDDG